MNDRFADVTETVITNARIVLADTVATGTVRLKNGRIADIDTGNSYIAGALDFEGDYLTPGLVDIHTDHLEKHVFPRAHVRWNMLRAVLSHDSQIIGGGVTTVFDSLSVGASIKNPERRDILGPMIDALESAGANGMLRAEHLVHLRCETTDDETPGLTEANIHRDIVRVVSVMEHVPGRRQSRDIGAYIHRRMVETGWPKEKVETEMQALLDRLDHTVHEVRASVIAMANSRNLPLLSHDDSSIAEVRMAHDEGIRISEFPVNFEAAREAHACAMLNVAGAPNVLRGGSQSGNIAVTDLLAENLVDILASDYVPRSMLDCAFLIGLDEIAGLDLPGALRLVTANPARACGLDDRGEILPGLRADLLRVSVIDKTPVLRSVWRQGRVVN